MAKSTSTTKTKTPSDKSKTSKSSSKSSSSKSSSKKSSKSKSRTKVVVNETPAVVETDPAPAVVVQDEESPAAVGTKSKKTVSTEDYFRLFDELTSYIDEVINEQRENPKHSCVKSLRSVRKQLGNIRQKSNKFVKQKAPRKVNTNSGFLKPVRISKELAEFTGWDEDEPKSRVDVTKFICNYIKEKQLQNPDDRRQILADKPLQKLLSYDPDKSEEPLKYFSIQTHIKKHFPQEA